ncbi:hypothetical protein K466DRAFT_448386, partial [Polyporus arcularius HHB13444]
WHDEVQNYLDEFMRLEGRGDYSGSTCPRCSNTFHPEDSPGYRCDDCDDSALYCKTCTIAQHIQQPLHRVKRWAGTYYEAVTLKSLGLRVQLGHRPGNTCYNPITAAGDTFIVLDLHGIHEVGLDFCGCEAAVPTVTQLLRYRWFPA